MEEPTAKKTLEDLFGNDPAGEVDQIADNMTGFMKDWAEVVLVINNFIDAVKEFIEKYFN